MKKMFVMAFISLLFLSGCSPTAKNVEPQPEEPRLSVTPAYKDFETQGKIITDTETGRQFLFYGSYKYGGGLIELTQPEPEEEEPTPPPAEPEPPAAEEPEPARYPLTDSERELVELVVMAESGNQPYCGQVAVAQCLLNDCERSGIRPAEAIKEYQYTSNRVSPSESVCEAVSAVFDRGEVATNDKILWFYAPARATETPWHETQRYVMTINDHKFFAEKE